MSIDGSKRLTSTEGDVDGIMNRPEGNSEQDQRAREKWYARDTPTHLDILGCHVYQEYDIDNSQGRLETTKQPLAH